MSTELVETESLQTNLQTTELENNNVSNILDWGSLGIEETPQIEEKQTFKIPDIYKDKEWGKNIKSVDDLWNLTANAQSLIGKKTIGIPGDKATEEELKNFNKAFGVPETADGYNFKEDENSKTIYGEYATEINTSFKNLLHSAGVNKKQADILKQGYDGIMNGIQKKIGVNSFKLDTQFEELAAKVFGDKKDVALNQARKLIHENMPESFKGYLDALPNEQLIIMAGVVNNMNSKYVKEDNLALINNGRDISGQSEENLRAEIQNIIASKDFQNPLSPNHDIAKRKWLETASRLDIITKNKK